MIKCGNELDIVFNLFNSPFCGRIIYYAVASYQANNGKAFPFPLVYFILPISLDKKLRNSMKPRQSFLNWVTENRVELNGFARLVEAYIKPTHEAIEFLLYTQDLILNDYGELKINEEHKKLTENSHNDDDEIKECIKKAKLLAKWMAKMNNVESVYFTLGVRP